MRMPKPARRRRFHIERLEGRVVLSMVAWYPHDFVANDDGFVISKDNGPANLAVLGNDFDGTGYGNWGETADLKLEIVAVTKPEHGSIGITEDGRSIRYTPESGYAGIDSFSYTIKNTAGDTDEAQGFVHVAEPLFAMSDWFRVDGGTSGVELEVLQNDSLNVADFEGGTGSDLSLQIKTIGATSNGGSATMSSDGRRIVYTPSAGFTGKETFTYTIEDENGYQAETTVAVEVGSAGGESSVSTDQIQQLLLEAAIEQWRTQFGQYDGADVWPNYDHWRWMTLDRATVGLAQPIALEVSRNSLATQTAGADSGSANASVDAAYSTTNIQVDGVDEGDIVKTDGEYLYVLSDWFDDQNATEEHQLIIVSVNDPTTPAVVSRYEFDGDVIEAYLHDDRVTVLSQADGRVIVTFLDVTDRTDPQLVGESRIDGSLEATRAIGDLLYVIVDAYGAEQLPGPETSCAAGVSGCFYETKQEFVTRVRDTIAASLPDVDVRDSTGQVVDEQGLFESSNLLAFSFTRDDRLSTVLTIDTSAASTSPISSTTFAHGTTSDIYVSSEAIYVLEQSRPSHDTPSHQTQIEKLAFAADGHVQWEASGYVNGYLLNRFSVDEYEGYLRIATTTSQWGGVNSLYVLQQSGNQLEIVGSVEGLAKGERIYSARFEASRGFVVTYRKVDPLFVFDLSDPTNPEVLGALKVSGYSNYLQLIDENHLLGIGREANGGGLFQEIQVSLFDVSDFSNPKLLHRYGFEGGRKLWSPIMQDAWRLGTHHGVSYFASFQTLVMPVYEGDRAGWSWVREGETADVSMRVLHIDVNEGIKSLGAVDFDTPFDPHQARSVRVGDVFYSISPDLIKANKLLEADTQLGEVFIGAGATDDTFQMRGTEATSLDVLNNDFVEMAEGEPRVVSVRQPARGGTVTLDQEDGSVSFQPASDYVGPVTFSYTLGLNSNYRDVAKVTIDLKPLWHNDGNPNDVNLDGRASPLDVLNFVNFINSEGVGDIETFESTMASEGKSLGAIRPDADDDGYISSLDLLLLVNYLNSLDLRGTVPGSGFRGELEAEGEAAASRLPAAREIDVALEDDSLFDRANQIVSRQSGLIGATRPKDNRAFEPLDVLSLLDDEVNFAGALSRRSL